MKEIKELIALKDQKKALEAQIKAIEKIIMEECLANGVKEIYDEELSKQLRKRMKKK